MYDNANIATLIAAYTYDISSEATLQNEIEECLRCAGVEYLREERLTQDDRIDFLVGDVGIEVKIKGGAAALIRQLHRYAQCDRVGSLLVVTTVPRQ